MKKFLALVALSGLAFSCSNDDDTPMDQTDDMAVATCSDGMQNGDETGVDCGGSCTPCDTSIAIPATYIFERDGASTVSFSGQTTRLLMANEILSKLKDPTATLDQIAAMYAHQPGAMDFEGEGLNDSDKQVRNKTAGSYTFGNEIPSVASLGIQAQFDAYITEQVNDVFPAWNEVATAGNPGQLSDGSSTRYVNGKGLELDQAFNKGLIGAFVGDQILNNYTYSEFIDQFEAANDEGTLVDDKSYTDLEHDWDEAYGYAFGVVDNMENPIADVDALDATDKFLAKYIKRVENDPTFTGIAQDIFDAFKAGRTAIINKDYTERNAQADILRQKIAEVIAVRAVFYLQAGKGKIGGAEPGDQFHDLSEGYGFIYSLLFMRVPGSAGEAVFLFSSTEVNGFLDTIYNTPTNGFWDVTAEDLDSVSEAIAAKFDFTVADAADNNN